MNEKKIEISDLADIGAAIMLQQATLSAGETLRLRFLDGGDWVGTLSLSRDSDPQDSEDLSYHCQGSIFGGGTDDRGILLSFQGEPDGPVDLPIRHKNSKGICRTWTSEEEDLPNQAQLKAGFYADGCSWTRDNAPQLQPIQPSLSARAGQSLADRANKAEKAWGNTRISQKDESGKLKWFRVSELLKQSFLKGA